MTQKFTLSVKSLTQNRTQAGNTAQHHLLETTTFLQVLCIFYQFTVTTLITNSVIVNKHTISIKLLQYYTHIIPLQKVLTMSLQSALRKSAYSREYSGFRCFWNMVLTRSDLIKGPNFCSEFLQAYVHVNSVDTMTINIDISNTMVHVSLYGNRTNLVKEIERQSCYTGLQQD